MLIMLDYVLPLQEPSEFKVGKSHFHFEGACACESEEVTVSHRV